LFACVDVGYHADPSACAACLLFKDWADEQPLQERSLCIDRVAPYVPGRFYERELPAILAVIEPFVLQIETILIDGYVYLDAGRPGLGAKLFESLDQKVAVVGVAKTRFREAEKVVEIKRGQSARPLFVTTAGISLAQAAVGIERMHGAFRIPTLLKRVDQLSRAKSC
jgi:deoxyribonuclease V